MILTEPELELLTGAKRHDAQARELDFLGVPYRKRRDGSIVVLRDHLNASASHQEQAPPALHLS